MNCGTGGWKWGCGCPHPGPLPQAGEGEPVWQAGDKKPPHCPLSRLRERAGVRARQSQYGSVRFTSQASASPRTFGASRWRTIAW